MTRLVVRVDGAGPRALGSDETPIDVWTAGGKRNVLIDPDQVVQRFLAEVPARCRDAFTVAGAVYAADGRVKRGRVSDPFDDTWTRDFVFHVAVHDLAFWSDPETTKRLIDAVSFLGGDSVEFSFSAAPGRSGARQPPLPTDLGDPKLREADTIVLLSGGLDSLAATLQARDEGRKPLLVSHRPAPQIQSRQENVVRLLRARDPDWTYPHVSVLLHNVERRPVEFTQRTRSFLYASLASITAQHLGIADLRICDNGVVSLNLPPSGQAVGTMLSRSTHPGFLHRMEGLARLITDNSQLTMSNALLAFTKREVVELIAKLGTPQLIQETVSCAHTERRPRGQPHCGVCTQCIDRRFATVAAGFEEHDLPERYEHDVFIDDLPEGTARTHAENYLRFAHELRRYHDSPAQFFCDRGADLVQALPELNVDAFVAQAHDLFQRHQRNVHAVLATKTKQHAEALAAGDLPEHCLLRMTGAPGLKEPPRERYMARLARILSDSLPMAFQDSPPADERAMQSAGEALLHAASETLEREAPQVPFGCVSVRPDFSKVLNSADALYVEFKLIRKRNERGRIHREIAADVTQYPESCHVLFIIFDSARALADPSKLKRAIEDKRANAMLFVVR